jgi:PncC family amidohydrolase
MQERDLLFHAEATAETLINKLKLSARRQRPITVALAESCTAGMVSNLLGSFPGASRVLWGSFVCYTKEAKISMLGIDGGELDAHGLVSAETARAMAEKTLEKSGADVAASVTGLAGPAQDKHSEAVQTNNAARRSPDKSSNDDNGGFALANPAGADGDGSDVPVGTVYVAVTARDKGTSVKAFNFKGDRNEVRIRAAIAVLEAINALT